jgi:hypothetical protein
MNTKSIFLFFCLISFMSVNASVERNMLSTGRSATMLSELLLTSGDWVPYPSYSNRAGWDVLLGDRKANLVKNGESRLDYTWKVIPATAYLEYERSGNRNIMQDPNSDNNEALADLLMAELAEGKGRFLDQIINGVFYNCERTSWVLSAHLPLQLSTRTLPDHTDSVIDLGSGELGAMLAWTYFFFNREFDRVNPIISKRLYKELYDKIIIPYRTIDRYWWMAFVPREDGMVNNWNPWTNFNCLQVIALLENDKVQMGKDVYRSMVSVDKFINYVNFDGACEEGPSYWSHAAGKLYDYLELVKMITNGQVNLFGEQIIRNMGEYISRSYIGNGWVVNFADASAQFSTSGGLVYRYGKAVNSKEMMQFGAYLDQRNQSLIPSGTDLFRTLESLRYYDELMATNAVHRPAPVTTYPETQFYYFSDEATGFLAVKGGYNAESHNHNDAGTFSLWVDKLPLFIDAGVGTYTRQTFGPERYTIWTMRSAFHNLPSINGKEQVFGKQYKATSIKVNESKKSVSMELAGAYPAETSVKSWNRGYQLSKGKLVITDKFLLNEWKAPHQLHFMVWGHIEQKPGKISIHTKDKKAQLLYDAGNYDYQLETIELTDPRLSRVWGNEIYRITLTNKSKKRQSTSHITILY